MFLAHVLDVAEPVVGEADAFATEHGADTAAAVVTDDHDVFHTEDIDRLLDHGEAVRIGVDDDVGEIAVDEDLAGEKADDFVGGNAAVRATNPKVFGMLLPRKFLGKFRIAAFDGPGRGPVLCEEMGETGYNSRVNLQD